jgi:DNA-binding MarR family transcriptional regulator
MDIVPYVNASDRQLLAERLYRLTTHLARNSGTTAVALLDEIGVRPSQIKALHLINFAGTPLTVTHLAELLGASQPTASRAVAGLLQHGLVACTVSDTDRRARLVTATATGRDAVQRLAAARINDLGVFTDGLSDGAAQRLSRALNQIDLATDDEPQPAGVGA